MKSLNERDAVSEKLWEEGVRIAVSLRHTKCRPDTSSSVMDTVNIEFGEHNDI